MRKIISKIAGVFLGLSLAMGVGVSLAHFQKSSEVKADETLVFNTTNSQISESGSNKAIQVSGVTLTFSSIGEVGSNFVRNEKNATITSSEIPGTIVSVKIYNCATTSSKTDGGFTVYGGTSASAITTEVEEITGLSSSAADKTISFSAVSCTFFKIVNGGDRVLKHSKIDVVYTTATQKTVTGLAVTGSMTKTSYLTNESWDPTGLVVTATYDNDPGDTEDVTSKVSWTYDPAVLSTDVESVVATASYKGQSANSSAQSVNVSGVPGTAERPYTVAEARAAIDASSGTSGVYVKGFVESVPYSYTDKNGVTFNIVDNKGDSEFVQAYKCKNTEGPSLSGVTVGDIVVVRGNLTLYGSTYEFESYGCYLVSEEEPQGTKYAVTDRIENGTLSVSEVLEGTTLNVSIIPDIGYYYPASLTYVRMAGTDVAYNYSNGAISVQNVQGNIVIEGACVESNPIRSLYTWPKGATGVEFYAYYAGFLTGSGPILMNGEYGVLLFNKDQDISEWTAGETMLHVTAGTIDWYSGLLEVKNYTVSVVGSSSASAPVVYAAHGGETQEYSSRLTTVTGIATLTSGSFATAGAGDIKLSFNVSGQAIEVFYKDSAQTADANAFNALKTAVTESSSITIKGFTSWYNGFQVQMNGYVPAAEGYTAEDFAQDLLDQTDAICDGYKEGDNNHDALVAIWSDLASNDKYPSLPQDEKDALAEADRNEKGTVVEQAMARYDFLTGKYELTNFIIGRTPIVVAHAQYTQPISSNNVSAIIIVVIALTSITSIGILLVMKRKYSSK